MPDYQVQVILHTTSGVAEDYVTNTWSCTADDVAGCILFIDAVRAFYNATGDRFSNLITQTGHQVKAYDRADPPPRAPVVDITWNLTPTPAGNPLPPEVALCLSFQGPKESGIPQARRRGRIYFGLISTAQLDTNGRPTAVFVSDLTAAASTLKAASTAAPEWLWTVYSPTSNASIGVSNGWVDNEWDTQRRRGRKATARTAWT